MPETKPDDSFPLAKFILKGYGVPYRFDRNSKGDGLLFYIREDIPSKFLKLRFDCNTESICVEINLRKRKWFIMVHIILVKASYQVILSFLIASLMNTAKIIKFFYFWVISMPPQMKSAWKSVVI